MKQISGIMFPFELFPFRNFSSVAGEFLNHGIIFLKEVKDV